MLNSELASTVGGVHQWAANTMIGSKGEYRRSDFIFERTQSAAMRDAVWADRINPIQKFPAMQSIGVAAGLVLAAAIYFVA